MQAPRHRQMCAPVELLAKRNARLRGRDDTNITCVGASQHQPKVFDHVARGTCRLGLSEHSDPVFPHMCPVDQTMARVGTRCVWGEWGYMAPAAVVEPRRTSRPKPRGPLRSYAHPLASLPSSLLSSPLGVDADVVRQSTGGPGLTHAAHHSLTGHELHHKRASLPTICSARIRQASPGGTVSKYSLSACVPGRRPLQACAIHRSIPPSHKHPTTIRPTHPPHTPPPCPHPTKTPPSSAPPHTPPPCPGDIAGISHLYPSMTTKGCPTGLYTPQNTTAPGIKPTPTFAPHPDPSCSPHNATHHIPNWIGTAKMNVQDNKDAKVRKHRVAAFEQARVRTSGTSE